MLHYRTSYGQNILGHSKEVALLCAHMASELGLDMKLAKRCGLLHDIGKAIDRESEGTHAQLGGEIVEKHGENEIVVNAVAAHHEDIEAISPYPILVQAADATSRLTGSPVKEETIDVTMPTPAEGPSLGVAPSGTWTWMSFFSNCAGSMPNSSARLFT